MQELPIDQRVRRCYEDALAAGLEEKAAIDAAFVLWRTARPDTPMDTARQTVSRIIAQARVEKRTGRPADEFLREQEN